MTMTDKITQAITTVNERIALIYDIYPFNIKGICIIKIKWYHLIFNIVFLIDERGKRCHCIIDWFGQIKRPAASLFFFFHLTWLQEQNLRVNKIIQCHLRLCNLTKKKKIDDLYHFQEIITYKMVFYSVTFLRGQVKFK